MSLSVRLCRSEQEIPDSLWADCFPPPLEGRWWFRAMERGGMDDQFLFLYALLEDNGRPVGLAPAFVMDVAIELVMPEAVLPIARLVGKVFPKVLYQRSLFIGSPCSDEGHIGLLEGIDRRAALLALQRAFEAEAARQKAAVLVWKDFRSDWEPDFAWLRQQAKLFPVVSFPGAEVALPSGGRDGYYAGLKASRRHAINRKLKRSRQLAELTAEVVGAPDDALLDQLFALFWQTYENANTRFEVLTKDFFAALAAEPESHFLILREAQTGTPVAFMLCFLQGTALINKFIGLDYGRPRDWALYFRLWDEMMAWAGGLGVTQVQSGQTGYSAKVEMGHHLVPLTLQVQQRIGLLHWIYGKVAKTIGWRSLDKDLGIYLDAHPDEEALGKPPET